MPVETYLWLAIAALAAAVCVLAYLVAKPRQSPPSRAIPPLSARALQHQRDALHNPNYRGGASASAQVKI